jgi:hypothetical protein
MELINSSGDGGKNALILDVRGLIKWIQIKNSVKWYWECVASYYFNSQCEHTS